MVEIRRMVRRGRRVVHGASAVYHVVNRIAFRRMVLDEQAKAVFLKMLRKQAVFAGVEVLAYCVMTNHFHILVRVPEPCEVDDGELMRRYRELYEAHCPASAADPDVLEKLLSEGGSRAEEWRKRLLDRMHRLSPFMAELKQRFTIWYNQNRNNQGTVWSERFRSTIVQDAPEFAAPVAAYIDLNPVRAELVKDPAEYGYSSYGHAMRGDRSAQSTLTALYHGLRSWAEAIKSYRILLFGKGSEAKGTLHKDTGLINSQRAAMVIADGGKLSWAEYLRTRVGYFTRGGILGSVDFVEGLADSLDAAQEKVRRISRRAHELRGLGGEMRALGAVNRGLV